MKAVLCKEFGPPESLVFEDIPHPKPGPGEVVRVTCRHDVHKRMHGEHGVPNVPRYVLWGEGSTDEMCLGILQVTRG